MGLHNIVSKTGGDLYAGGGAANIPAPGHSDRDRSVSLKIGRQGQVVAATFAGTDWREVLDDLRERGLIDSANRPLNSGGLIRPSIAAPLPTHADRQRVAKAIWELGRAAGPRTLSGRHMSLRHIGRALPDARTLRHTDSAPLKAFDPACRRTHAALLVAVRDGEDRLTAVEITFLDPNARRSRRVGLSRKTVGPLPAGSAVRIDEVDQEMLVGEGVFTTLSGSERFGLPAWALLGTRNMRRFTPPPTVRRLVIAADRGADGRRSAAILADRAGTRGLRVWVEYPPLPAQDWNEAAADKSGWRTVQASV